MKARDDCRTESEWKASDEWGVEAEDETPVELTRKSGLQQGSASTFSSSWNGNCSGKDGWVDRGSWVRGTPLRGGKSGLPPPMSFSQTQQHGWGGKDVRGYQIGKNSWKGGSWKDGCCEKQDSGGRLPARVFSESTSWENRFNGNIAAD